MVGFVAHSFLLCMSLKSYSAAFSLVQGTNNLVPIFQQVVGFTENLQNLHMLSQNRDYKEIEIIKFCCNPTVNIIFSV